MNPDDIEIDTEAVAEQVGTLWGQLQVWFDSFLEQALSEATLWQAGVVVLAVVVAWLIARIPYKRLVEFVEERGKPDAIGRLFRSIASVMWPLFTVILVWAAIVGFMVADLNRDGLRIVASLLMAWIIIRLLTANMKKSFLSRTIAIVAWTVAALYILRWLRRDCGLPAG